MEKIPRPLRIALFPILYVASLILWLASKIAVAVLGLIGWFLVVWVRWRQGRDAAEQLRRALVEAENAGRAWRRIP